MRDRNTAGKGLHDGTISTNLEAGPPAWYVGQIVSSWLELGEQGREEEVRTGGSVMSFIRGPVWIYPRARPC